MFLILIYMNIQRVCCKSTATLAKKQISYYIYIIFCSNFIFIFQIAFSSI
jgi:hypothetical protein